MKNGQAVRLLFEIAPVRVGLGDVTAEYQVISIFADDEREMRGEGTVVSGGDEDGEWIRAHEGNGIGMVTDAEVFGDVHEFSIRLSMKINHHRVHGGSQRLPGLDPSQRLRRQF